MAIPRSRPSASPSPSKARGACALRNPQPKNLQFPPPFESLPSEVQIAGTFGPHVRRCRRYVSEGVCSAISDGVKLLHLEQRTIRPCLSTSRGGLGDQYLILFGERSPICNVLPICVALTFFPRPNPKTDTKLSPPRYRCRGRCFSCSTFHQLPLSPGALSKGPEKNSVEMWTFGDIWGHRMTGDTHFDAVEMVGSPHSRWPAPGEK